jgi:hypothetical protein
MKLLVIFVLSVIIFDKPKKVINNFKRFYDVTFVTVREALKS